MLFGDCALHCAVKSPMPAGRPPRKVALDAGTLAVAFNGERAREGTRSERLCHPATRRAALSLCSVLYLPAWSGLGSCVFCDHPPPVSPPLPALPSHKPFFPGSRMLLRSPPVLSPSPRKTCVGWLPRAAASPGRVWRVPRPGYLETQESRGTHFSHEPLRGAGGGSGIVFTGKSDTRSRLD